MRALESGLPAVAVVTEQFVSLARTVARGLKHPDLPMVVVPHPFEMLPPEQVKRIAEDKIEEVVSRISKGPWV